MSRLIAYLAFGSVVLDAGFVLALLLAAVVLGFAAYQTRLHDSEHRP